MPSPFPGMDPYLELPAHWPGFRRAAVAAAYQLLVPAVADAYRARVAVRNYTTELVLFTSILREPQAEEYVEIRGRGDGRLVTLIDFVGPTNRTTAAGRDAYLATRRHAETARAAVLEIDLIRAGTPPLEFDRAAVPPHHYTATLTRAGAPNRYEVYHALIQTRLPRVKVPLAADDRDATLDLQDVFRRAYDAAGFAKRIDYAVPLPAGGDLPDDARDWAAAIAKTASVA